MALARPTHVACSARPAFAENGRLDALGANQLGRGLYPVLFGERRRQPANWARFVFLNAEAPNFYGDWDRTAKDCVAILRSEAGRHPHDRELSDLVGELATQSEEFRGLWAAHNVRLHTKGIKRFNHPIVGELELSFNRLEVMADPGLMIVAYTAEPGSRSAEAFGLLASWAATRESHWATSSISWSTYGDQIMQYANFLAELCRRSNHGNPLGCRAFRPTRNRCTVV